MAMKFTEYDLVNSKDNGRFYFSLCKFSKPIAYASGLSIKFGASEDPSQSLDSLNLNSKDSSGDSGQQFRRYRRFRKRQKFQWILKESDKKSSSSNEWLSDNIPKGSGGILVPPTSQNGVFEFWKLEESFRFDKKSKFEAFTIEQANELMAEKPKFGSGLMAKIMDKQKAKFRENNNETSGKQTQRMDIEDEFVNDDMEALEHKDKEEDVEELAIDRMETNAESFADFDGAHFTDDEDDAKEINNINKNVEEDKEEKEAEVFQSAQEALEEAEKEEENELAGIESEEDEDDLDKMFDGEEPPSDIIGKGKKKSDQPIATFELPDPAKTERQRFAESLIMKPGAKPSIPSDSSKRKIDSESNPATKRQRTEAASFDDQLKALLTSLGGRVKTKAFLKAAKKAGLVQDNKRFKAAFSKLFKVEEDLVNGKVVVLK